MNQPRGEDESAREGGELPRVLVGTLYSGERELEQCLESVRQQTHARVEHRVFRDLPNKEAHDTLYRSFMEASRDFGVFVKLDADMVFADPEALRRIVRYFRSDRSLDHVVLGVKDWASDSLIMGLHAYSPRAKWGDGDGEKLFVDPDPRIPGRRLRIPRPEVPPVIHAPDPSPFQAFRLGVHRGLKVVQREREDFWYYRALDQWDLLDRVWRQFEAAGDRRRGLIVAGADLALRGCVSVTAYTTLGDDLETRYSNDWADQDSHDLHELLRDRWGSRPRRESALARSLGFRTYGLLALRRLKKRSLGLFLRE